MDDNILGNGSVEILDIMGDDLAVANAARVSYLGQSKGIEKDKQLIYYLMEHGHMSPFEHVQVKFRIKCPLFVARQWMRYRTWKYNEISRRYTSVDIDFYLPDELRLQDEVNKQGSIDTNKDNSHLIEKIKKHNEKSHRLYNELRENDISRELSRIVFPVSLNTTFIATVDLRNLFNFLHQRMDAHAQYEIRQYANHIYNELKLKFPISMGAFDEHYR